MLLSHFSLESFFAGRIGAFDRYFRTIKPLMPPCDVLVCVYFMAVGACVLAVFTFSFNMLLDILAKHSNNLRGVLGINAPLPNPMCAFIGARDFLIFTNQCVFLQ